MRVERVVWTGLALACAVVSAWLVYRLPILYSQDSVHYLSLAEHLARGDGYHSDLYLFPDLMQPPLYPLLIAVGIRCGLTAIVSAVVVCALAQAGSLLLVVALYRATFGRRGLLVVGLAAIVYANLAIGTGLLLEPLYCFLLAFAAWAAIASDVPGLSRALVCGMGVGLALVTRSEAVITAGVLGAALLFWPGQKRRIVVCTVALVGAALVVMPYGLWMRAHLGQFEVLPKLRYNVPFADITDHMDWPTDEEQLTARDLRTHEAVMPDHATFVLDYAFSHPAFDPRTMFPRRQGQASDRLGLLVRTAYRMVVDGVRQTGLAQPLVLLLIVGGLFRGWRESRARSVSLAALMAANLLPGLLSGENYQTRFTAPALLFSLPLIVGGIEHWVQVVARRWPTMVPFCRVALAVALLLLLGSRTRRHLNEIAGGPRLEARAYATDAAMSRIVPEHSSVLCEHARVAFLRHARSYQTPYAPDRRTFLDYIEKHSIDYALLDTRLLKKHPGPENRRLADRANWPLQWQLLEELFPDDEPIWVVRVGGETAPRH